jgi:CheY-like chemotaxis protein
VTRGENCDARWPGSPPSRQEATRIARPSDGSKAESDCSRKSGGGLVRRFLYFNPESAHGKYVDIIRQRGGHDLATASSGADALAMMRRQLFDALVMDCALDTLDVQDFTAKAQGLQPSLAVFLADEWGDELVTGLGEFEHVLTMLEDDECARLAAESRIG